ncbi:MAG: phosphoribosyltransferase [Ferroplasma sp.]
MDFKATYVSWKNIEDWTKGIMNMVIDDGYSPDIIIGIARGGLVPARMVSDYLFIKDLLTIKTEHWGLTATMDGRAVLKEKINVDISGKKILIIDDITDTGESMKISYDYLKSLNPGEIKTASMLYVNGSTYTPDYYGIGLAKEEWAWFIFPWNVYEDTYNLSKKVVNSAVPLEEFENALKTHYNLNTNDVNLNEIVNNIAKLKKISLNDALISIK